MWLAIGKFFLGQGFTALIDGYKAKLAAGNTSEKIAADLAAKDLELQGREAEVNSKTIIAEQGRWYTAIIRPLMALPFVVFAWKVVVWDKVLGWGSTDPLDPNMWSVFLAIVTCYFGGRTLEKIARIVRK
jgi:hypothetical protein